MLGIVSLVAIGSLAIMKPADVLFLDDYIYPESAHRLDHSEYEYF